jgi:hypothetical protein
MYQKFLFLAGLVLASTAQAQTPQNAQAQQTSGMALMIQTPGHGIAGVHSGTATGRVVGDAAVSIGGNRALLGQVEKDAYFSDPARVTNAPIDGSQAVLGNWPSALPIGAGGAERQSYFRAEVRGDVISDAWGEAEFGTVHTVDHSSAAFVISLGVCGEQSAVLFTRRSGAPLAVGRYRISEGANGADEILALVLTRSPTRPTGVFRGESGWLVVAEASDQFIAGQFEVDATGFTAAEPQNENRQVNISGSFSATTGSSSFRICEDAK